MTILLLPGPAIAIFLVVFASVLLLLGIWERVVRVRSRNWPVTQGTIEKVWVRKHSGKRTRWIARLDYSYSVQNKRYTGRYSQSHSYQEDAEEYVRDLSGKAIMVHYSPRWPVFSVAANEDVKALLLTRTPELPHPDMVESQPSEVPLIKKLVAYPLMLFAAAGFILSLYVHVASWLGKIVLPESWFFLINAGMFVSFIGGIVLIPKGPKKKQPFKNPPDGFLRKALIIVFFYSIANFAVFFVRLFHNHGEAPELWQWQGFSGHWMLFYLAGLFLLYHSVHPSNDAVVN